MGRPAWISVHPPNAHGNRHAREFCSCTGSTGLLILQCVCRSARLSAHVSVFCPFARLSVRPPACVSVCLSVCPDVSIPCGQAEGAEGVEAAGARGSGGAGPLTAVMVVDSWLRFVLDAATLDELLVLRNRIAGAFAAKVRGRVARG
jgi:hypothetical protein